MSAPKFLQNAFKSTVSALGGESITIKGESVLAVLGEEQETEDLVLGGEADHRTLTALFPSDSLTFQPRKGQTCHAREQDWQIHMVDAHNQTTTRIELRSPSRRI